MFCTSITPRHTLRTWDRTQCSHSYYTLVKVLQIVSSAGVNK